MEEIWVVYLCMVLFVLILILMKQKPEDEIKKKTDGQSPSTSTSQFISSAGRALEYTEEELEASLQKLSSLFFSTDTQKKQPHSDHRVHQRESAGKEPQVKISHPAAQQNILDEIEQAVQETADTEVYTRRRPQQSVPRRHHEESQ
ncbi:uncharacterized protein PHA67_004892 [Liasis olivaceus]